MAEVITFHYEMVVSLLKRKGTLRLMLSLGVSAVLFRLFRHLYERHSLKVKLKVKQDRLTQEIGRLRERISTNSLEIQLSPDQLQELVQLSVGELREKLDNGSVKPVDILQAFQRQALSLYDQKNSGICEFILEADEQAKSLEKLPKRGAPLFGIPISIKESLSPAGYDATFGLVKRCQQPQERDSVILKALKASGALPFVITMTSQCCRSISGYNPVFGSVRNPFVASQLPGGSSTGEAVLLSQGGSPVGIGTDILGSIRIPAAYCGLASLKPTSGRVSSLGLASISQQSTVHLKVCSGPMARHVEDLVDVMRTLLTRRMFRLDPCVPPMPFDEQAYQGVDKPQLVIGCYNNLPDPSLISTVPVVRQTVALARQILEDAGHTVVDFHPPKPLLAHHLALRAISADGGRELRSWLRYEQMCPQVATICLVTSMPYYLKLFSNFLLCAFGYRPLAVAHTLCGLSTGRAAVELLNAIEDYRRQFFKACQNTGPLDAIICPVAPYPAPPNNRSLIASPSIIYTSIFNLVDLPAGTVPLGTVDEADIISASTSAVDFSFAGRFFDASVMASMQDSHGLPLSVQVVGMPYREEVVLRLMRTIEKAVTAATAPT